MNNFQVQGGSTKDFWTVGGSIDWAIIPAGIINGFHCDMPIRLQVGNQAWGQAHIDTRHGHWLRKQGGTIAEILYAKLGQSGSIYSTEKNGKIKIAMTLSPSALLVLDSVSNKKYGDFFAVTTLYGHNGRADGECVGRYISAYRVSANLGLITETT